ncbi:kinase-like domain-containing protein [Phascolomyces articulosus]|uniref:non-specific serine/threonine protein kinase n=1 Tax=Phascolomyces articulosus TaxID=60185 RepID=A0AAD5K717_9FUNG|nr:kinase-like domain-containing protein [Phascolomyces articulosus]
MIDSAYNSPSSTIDSRRPSTTSVTRTTKYCPDEHHTTVDSSCASSSRNNKSQTYQQHTGSVKEYGECYRRLGEGTSAIVMVFRKMDKSGKNTKLYAIKQFRKRSKAESEKEYMKKLTSEFCISSTFSHPNVVETIDLVLNEQKRYCTVMEYCPGGDLFSCIMAERISEREKLCCLKQLIQGLAYLHGMGVAHRDIKPENLLLTIDGQIKITDFGVSDVFRFAWEKQGHKSRGLVGSEPYIAPEAFEHKEYWGSIADVWSAGIVFYCLWTSGLVWRKAKKSSDKAFSIYTRMHPTQTFDPFLQHFPSAQPRQILYKMLDPNPNTRITSADLLEDPWIQSIPVCQHGIDSLNQRHEHVIKSKIIAK